MAVTEVSHVYKKTRSNSFVKSLLGNPVQVFVQ